jgi:hypothetical protein
MPLDPRFARAQLSDDDLARIKAAWKTHRFDPPQFVVEPVLPPYTPWLSSELWESAKADTSLDSPDAQLPGDPYGFHDYDEHRPFVAGPAGVVIGAVLVGLVAAIVRGLTHGR